MAHRPIAEQILAEQTQRYDALRREEMTAAIEREETVVADAAAKIADWEAVIKQLEAVDKVVAQLPASVPAKRRSLNSLGSHTISLACARTELREVIAGACADVSTRIERQQDQLRTAQKRMRELRPAIHGEGHASFQASAGRGQQ